MTKSSPSHVHEDPALELSTSSSPGVSQLLPASQSRPTSTIRSRFFGTGQWNSSSLLFSVFCLCPPMSFCLLLPFYEQPHPVHRLTKNCATSDFAVTSTKCGTICLFLSLSWHFLPPHLSCVAKLPWKPNMKKHVCIIRAFKFNIQTEIHIYDVTWQLTSPVNGHVNSWPFKTVQSHDELCMQLTVLCNYLPQGQRLCNRPCL